MFVLVAIQLIASVDHRCEIAPSAPEGRLLVPGQRRHAQVAETVVPTRKACVGGGCCALRKLGSAYADCLCFMSTQ
jgi:hypothetical protein